MGYFHNLSSICSTDGYEVSIKNATSINNLPGFLSMASDGTVARFISCDSSGRIIISGASSNGSAISGNPVLIAGYDGTSTRILLTDNTGKLQITTTSASTGSNGSLAPTSSTLFGGIDGSGNLSPATITTNGLKVAQTLASSATLTQVNNSTSSVSLLSANANRLGAIFYNDSNQDLYIAFNATATLSAYTVRILKNGGYYELGSPCYTGVISGVWAASGSNGVRITQISY